MCLSWSTFKFGLVLQIGISQQGHVDEVGFGSDILQGGPVWRSSCGAVVLVVGKFDTLHDPGQGFKSCLVLADWFQLVV
jgi:hypothetical protein